MVLKGLKFVDKYQLTRKEVFVLLQFINEPNSVPELAKQIGWNRIHLHNKVAILRLKGLLEKKYAGVRGIIYYGPTEEFIQALNFSGNE